MVTYLVIGGIGFLLMFLGFFLDDVLDIDEFFDVDWPWLDLKSISVGLVCFGAIGWLSTYFNAPVGLVLSLAFLAMVAGVICSYKFILKPLLRQQSNSLISEQSFVGRTGIVDIDIPADNWGMITFTDINGAYVSKRAIVKSGEDLPKGTRILIADVEDSVAVVVPEPDFS